MTITNISNFQTKQEFFQWWNSVDHMALPSSAFVFYILVHAHFHEQDIEFAAKRLMKAFKHIHSTNKWKASGRTKYDTLLAHLKFGSAFHLVRGDFDEPASPGIPRMYCWQNKMFKTMREWDDVRRACIQVVVETATAENESASGIG
jgi:hypothetical protein